MTNRIVALVLLILAGLATTVALRPWYEREHPASSGLAAIDLTQPKAAPSQPAAVPAPAGAPPAGAGNAAARGGGGEEGAGGGDEAADPLPNKRAPEAGVQATESNEQARTQPTVSSSRRRPERPVRPGLTTGAPSATSEAGSKTPTPETSEARATTIARGAAPAPAPAPLLISDGLGEDGSGQIERGSDSSARDPRAEGRDRDDNGGGDADDDHDDDDHNDDDDDGRDD